MLKRGEWLTDKHINAASVLIKEEFPKQLGLQDTLLLQHFDQYESEDSQFVQIVHVNGNHWLCVSNKFCPAGTVDIYDCSPGTRFSLSLKRQFNQSAMRQHFDLCVDKEKKDMFPVSTRCRQKKNTKSRNKSMKMVPVFVLVAYKADTVKGPLVECSQCKEWYHSKCDNIDLELYDAKNYCCSRCL